MSNVDKYEAMLAKYDWTAARPPRGYQPGVGRGAKPIVTSAELRMAVAPGNAADKASRHAAATEELKDLDALEELEETYHKQRRRAPVPQPAASKTLRKATSAKTAKSSHPKISLADLENLHTIKVVAEGKQGTSLLTVRAARDEAPEGAEDHIFGEERGITASDIEKAKQTSVEKSLLQVLDMGSPEEQKTWILRARAYRESSQLRRALECLKEGCARTGHKGPELWRERLSYLEMVSRGGEETREVAYLSAKKRVLVEATAAYPSDEGLWLDLLSLCAPHEVLDRTQEAVLACPESERLWLRLVDSVTTAEGQKRLLLRALKRSPRLPSLWGRLARLEGLTVGRQLFQAAAQRHPSLELVVEATKFVEWGLFSNLRHEAAPVKSSADAHQEQKSEEQVLLADTVQLREGLKEMTRLMSTAAETYLHSSQLSSREAWVQLAVSVSLEEWRVGSSSGVKSEEAVSSVKLEDAEGSQGGEAAPQQPLLQGYGWTSALMLCFIFCPEFGAITTLGNTPDSVRCAALVQQIRERLASGDASSTGWSDVLSMLGASLPSTTSTAAGLSSLPFPLLSTFLGVWWLLSDAYSALTMNVPSSSTALGFSPQVSRLFQAVSQRIPDGMRERSCGFLRTLSWSIGREAFGVSGLQCPAMKRENASGEAPSEAPYTITLPALFPVVFPQEMEENKAFQAADGPQSSFLCGLSHALSVLLLIFSTPSTSTSTAASLLLPPAGVLLLAESWCHSQMAPAALRCLQLGFTRHCISPGLADGKEKLSAAFRYLTALACAQASTQCESLGEATLSTATSLFQMTFCEWLPIPSVFMASVDADAFGASMPWIKLAIHRRSKGFDIRSLLDEALKCCPRSEQLWRLRLTAQLQEVEAVREGVKAVRRSSGALCDADSIEAVEREETRLKEAERVLRELSRRVLGVDGQHSPESSFTRRCVGLWILVAVEVEATSLLNAAAAHALLLQAANVCAGSLLEQSAARRRAARQAQVKNQGKGALASRLLPEEYTHILLAGAKVAIERVHGSPASMRAVICDLIKALPKKTSRGSGVALLLPDPAVVTDPAEASLARAARSELDYLLSLYIDLAPAPQRGKLASEVLVTFQVVTYPQVLLSVAKLYHQGAVAACSSTSAHIGTHPGFSKAMREVRKAMELSEGRSGDAIALLWTFCAMPPYTGVAREMMVEFGGKEAEERFTKGDASDRKQTETESSEAGPKPLSEAEARWLVFQVTASYQGYPYRFPLPLEMKQEEPATTSSASVIMKSTLELPHTPNCGALWKKVSEADPMNITLLEFRDSIEEMLLEVRRRLSLG